MNKVLKKIIIDTFPKKWVLSYQYKKYLGYYPDFKEPKTFNEKLNWLKVYKDEELNAIITDKYLARNYIKSKIGKKYLIPLLFQTKDPKDICKSSLPDIPFIIKVNHDCGGWKIIKNKEIVDWDGIRDFFSIRLKKNYYYYALEPSYKKIEPCIIVEKLLIDKNGDIPYDYKVYCFNGKAKIIAVDRDRGKETKSRNWYDLDWNKKDVFWNTKGDDIPNRKPKEFDKMVQLSEKLSSTFNFLRVDWYLLENKLYIGELTLYPGAGLVPFYPEKWDRILGDYLELK